MSNYSGMAARRLAQLYGNQNQNIENPMLAYIGTPKSWTFDCSHPIMRGFICQYLDAKVYEVGCDISVLDGHEELTQLPHDALIFLELKDVFGPGFMWGNMVFGEYQGRKFVAEQCASPYAVYYKVLYSDLQNELLWNPEFGYQYS